jgi:hypothetical protein
MMSHKEFNNLLIPMSLTDAGFELQAAASRCIRKREFEIIESQLSVRLADALSIKTFLSSQEAEEFKKSYTSPSIQTITLRGHTASDSDSYMLTILKTLAGKKSEQLINEFKRSFHAYSSLIVDEPKKPISILQAVILADNAIALYDKFIRRSTKMTIPNKVDDLKGLCIDILRNRFTESFGMVVSTELELNPERSKPYAHSKWYQNILTTSSEYETKLANIILERKNMFIPKTGVISKRPIITKNDMFELTNSAAPARTVLIDCKSKDSFVNTIRTWISAKVRLILSRATIDAFINGNLTFAHDYYVGDNRFFRYAKNKYFYIKSGSTKGLHIIQTTLKEKGNKKITSYRHIILFSEDISNRRVEFTKKENRESDPWEIGLMDFCNKLTDIKMDYSYALPSNKIEYASDYRKTEKELDYVTFKSLKPGQEFNIDATEGSLCINLSKPGLILPITYLNPSIVQTVDLGYELKHSDMVIATNCYIKLRDITNNFAKSRILSWDELESALDFILVYSTTDTPDFIINKKLYKFLGININTVQLDLIRTFLVKNQKIGIGYSSSRFTQYLLNLGKRRRHEHSYLCKTISGARAEADSEDWDVLSAEEDILIVGESNPHEVRDFESDDGYAQPDHVKEGSDEVIDKEEDVVLQMEVDKEEVDALNTEVDDNLRSWADEVINTLSDDNIDAGYNYQTAEEYNLWSDSDSEEELESPKTVELEIEVDPRYNEEIHPITTTTPVDQSNTQSMMNFISTAANNMFSNFNLEDLSTVGYDSDEEVVKVNAVDTVGDLFSRALGGTYAIVKDIKDKGLKSERTGHTVSPSLENARAIITFLQGWLKTSGSAVELDVEGVMGNDISSITAMYLTMHKAKALDFVNPLERFYGLDNIKLPIALSALAVVGEVYN